MFVEILLLLLLIGGLIVLGLVGWRPSKQERIASRLELISSQRQRQSHGLLAQGGEQLLQVMVRLGSLLVPGARQRAAIEQLLLGAGYGSVASVPVFMASKLIVGVLMAVLAYLALPPALTGGGRVILTLVALFLGFLLPEAWLGRRAAQRRREIEESLPNAVDLMVICANAGYSLSQCLQRTAAELTNLGGALGQELAHTVADLEVGGDPAQALRGLARRAASHPVTSFTATLIQSQQYGTPISQALTALAKAERTAKALDLEEQAGKLATKITVPMIVLILPPVVFISIAPTIAALYKLLLA